MKKEKGTSLYEDTGFAVTLTRDHIYMGMGYCNEHMVCMSVGYSLAYCVKKAMQFEIASMGRVKFESVNEFVGKIGKGEKQGSWSREAVSGYIKTFLHDEYL